MNFFVRIFFFFFCLDTPLYFFHVQKNVKTSCFRHFLQVWFRNIFRWRSCSAALVVRRELPFYFKIEFVPDIFNCLSDWTYLCYQLLQIPYKLNDPLLHVLALLSVAFDHQDNYYQAHCTLKYSNHH